MDGYIDRVVLSHILLYRVTSEGLGFSFQDFGLQGPKGDPAQASGGLGSFRVYGFSVVGLRV